MPTYRVRSGDMDEKVKTAYPAQPMVIAVMAFAKGKPVKHLGQLLEIKGGEYTGSNSIYINPETVLEAMGAFPCKGARRGLIAERPA